MSCLKVTIKLCPQGSSSSIILPWEINSKLNEMLHQNIPHTMTLWTVATQAVFWNSPLQSLPETRHKYTWKDPDKFPATCITDVTFNVAFNMRCTSNGSTLCFRTFLSFFSSIHYRLEWKCQSNQQACSLSQQNEVLSITICWSQSMVSFQLVVVHICTTCPLPFSLLFADPNTTCMPFQQTARISVVSSTSAALCVTLMNRTPWFQS